jgi:hypothetical protein
MDKRLENINLIDELDNTFIELESQLINDQIRWGDTWKERGLVWNGMPQEERFFQTIQQYMDDYRENGVPVPWLRILGEAHIARVRERILSKVE